MIWKGRFSAAPSLDKLPVGLVEYQHILPDGTPTNFYQKLEWECRKYPHALLVGGTGSGKTTLLKNMLAQFIYMEKEAEIYLATYKTRCEDFSNIMENPHFGAYSQCQEVFNRFYERFQDRLNGSDKTRHMLLLFIDEWAGFLTSLNKKEQDQVVGQMGQIAMLGRSLNVQIILAMQRPDAVFFRNGARDNFNLIIGMGNMSSDGKRMIFPSDCIDQLQPVTEIGTGYALIGGYDLYRIRVPPLSEAVEKLITRKFLFYSRKAERSLYENAKESQCNSAVGRLRSSKEEPGNHPGTNEQHGTDRPC